MTGLEEAEERERILAVRWTLERYMSCIDRRDWRGLAECFTAGAEATYTSAGRASTLVGRAAIVERLQRVARFPVSTHSQGNVHVEMRGEEAHAFTNAVAQLLMRNEGGDRMLVRGLRYADILVREDGAWRIHRRTHEQVWQFETDAVTPRF